MKIKLVIRQYGLTIFVTLVVFVVGILMVANSYLDTNVVQRDMYLISQIDGFTQSVKNNDAFDEKLSADILKHLSLIRDGGEITAQYGPKWIKPATDNTEILGAISTVEVALAKQNFSDFKKAYLNFSQLLSEEIFQVLERLTSLKYFIVGVLWLCLLNVLVWLHVRLNRADESVLKVGNENEKILSATHEGLFLIDSNFEIGTQKSEALVNIFGSTDYVSGNFIELLKNHVDAENLVLTKEFIELLFEGRVLSDLMHDVNPLHEVEMDVMTRSGSSDRKFLNFNFARGNTKGAPESVLVSVSDVTNEVILRRELDSTKSLQKDRMNMFIGLLHINPDQLLEYCDFSTQQMLAINNILADEDLSQDKLRKNLDKIFRKAHRIKGDAAALGFTLFEKSMHQFEDELSKLKKMSVLDGRNLLALTVHLKEMIHETQVVRGLVPQLEALVAGNVSGSKIALDENLASKKPMANTPAIDFGDSMRTLASQVSQRQGKKVELDINGFEFLNNKPVLFKSISSICAQLIRNSISHGIESPEQRLLNNKTSFGIISLTLSHDQNNNVMMQVNDDGQGLQFDQIKKRALDASLLTHSKASQVEERSLLKYIFMSGFSSAKSVDNDSGRGVGLNFVFKEIQSLGGKIAVSSSPGEFCKFSLNMNLGDENGL